MNGHGEKCILYCLPLLFLQRFSSSSFSYLDSQKLKHPYLESRRECLEGYLNSTTQGRVGVFLDVGPVRAQSTGECRCGVTRTTEVRRQGVGCDVTGTCLLC